MNPDNTLESEQKYDPRERWHYPDELRAMLEYAERLHVATVDAVEAGGRNLSASVRIEHATTGEPYMWLHLLAENNGPVVTLYDPADETGEPSLPPATGQGGCTCPPGSPLYFNSKRCRPSNPPGGSCPCPDPLREVSALCPAHGHSPDCVNRPAITGDQP